MKKFSILLFIALILSSNLKSHAPDYGFPDHYDYADFDEKTSDLAVKGNEFGYGLIEPEYDNYH